MIVASSMRTSRNRSRRPVSSVWPVSRFSIHFLYAFGKTQLLRDDHPRQIGVHPGGGKVVHLGLNGRPHLHIVAADGQHPCQSHAPGACTQNTNTKLFHVCILRVCTGQGASPCRWICAAPGRCPAAAHYYDHCTRKHPQRQASAALHKYLTSLCNFSVTSHVLCKPFALRGISCYYSILVGFVGIGDSVS